MANIRSRFLKFILDSLIIVDTKSLKNREFSFTFSNGSYLRFQSFEDSEQLQSFLIKNTPVKIDLGAIYSAKVLPFSGKDMI